MQRAKGSVLILIGSILMIIAASLGILMGILIAIAGGWFFSLLASMGGEIVDASILGSLLSWGGLVIGIVVLAFSVLWLIFGIMCLNRRNDPARSTFPLVIGIIFTVLALFSLIQDISLASIYGIAAPLLILIGAALNKGQKQALPVYPPYPPGQSPYPPYPGPGQVPYPPQPQVPYPPQAPYPPYPPPQGGQEGPSEPNQPPSSQG